MIGIALSYAHALIICACLLLLRNFPAAPNRRAEVDRRRRIGPDWPISTEPTPCEGWTLADLLAHMTVQHRGFAAAARGLGADPDVWRVETVAAAVRADPGRHLRRCGTRRARRRSRPTERPTHRSRCRSSARARCSPARWRWASTSSTTSCTAGTSPHRSVSPSNCPPMSSTPCCRWYSRCPTATFRTMAGAPFAPAVEQVGGDDFERILRHLGRRPDWISTNPTSLRNRRCTNCLGTPSSRDHG